MKQAKEEQRKLNDISCHFEHIKRPKSIDDKTWEKYQKDI